MKLLVNSLGIICFPVGAVLVFQGWGIIKLGFLVGFARPNLWGAVSMLSGIIILVLSTGLRRESKEGEIDSSGEDGE